VVQEVSEIKRVMSGRSLSDSSHESQHDYVSCSHTLILYDIILSAHLFTWSDFHKLLNVLKD
jgi:hypothetical protein